MRTFSLLRRSNSLCLATCPLPLDIKNLWLISLARHVIAPVPFNHEAEIFPVSLHVEPEPRVSSTEITPQRLSIQPGEKRAAVN